MLSSPRRLQPPILVTTRKKKKKNNAVAEDPPKHMYTPGLERSHWTNEQHFARQMSLVLCRPSWEPAAFHLTFRSLGYFCSLSVTGAWASTNTFPKTPQVFMCVSVEGDWALWQPQEHPGARGPRAPWPGSWLSAGSGVGGRGSQPRSVPPSTHSVAWHEGWACSHILATPGHPLGHGGHPGMPEAGRAQWLRAALWPTHAWALQGGSRGEEALLSPWCPLSRESIH